MRFPWFESSECRRTRDRLLDQLTAGTGPTAGNPTTGEPSGTTRGDHRAAFGSAAPPALPAEMERHLEGCSSCQSLAAALPRITRLTPAWQVAQPPVGLAHDTALRLAPFWTIRERAVNRQEIRMIWSSGLALAATSIVALLMVVDGLFPLSSTGDHHPLVQVGLLVGAAQLIGGGLLSLTLLALDVRRRRSAMAAAESLAFQETGRHGPGAGARPGEGRDEGGDRS